MRNKKTQLAYMGFLGETGLQNFSMIGFIQAFHLFTDMSQDCEKLSHHFFVPDNIKDIDFTEIKPKPQFRLMDDKLFKLIANQKTITCK